MDSKVKEAQRRVACVQPFKVVFSIPDSLDQLIGSIYYDYEVEAIAVETSMGKIYISLHPVKFGDTNPT